MDCLEVTLDADAGLLFKLLRKMRDQTPAQNKTHEWIHETTNGKAIEKCNQNETHENAKRNWRKDSLIQCEHTIFATRACERRENCAFEMRENCAGTCRSPHHQGVCHRWWRAPVKSRLS